MLCFFASPTVSAEIVYQVSHAHAFCISTHYAVYRNNRSQLTEHASLEYMQTNDTFFIQIWSDFMRLFTRLLSRSPSIDRFHRFPSGHLLWQIYPMVLQSQASSSALLLPRDIIMLWILYCIIQRVH